MIRILFNQTQSHACSTNDWDVIDYAFYEFSLNQYDRNLRGANTTLAAKDQVDEESRELWPAYCANRCEGFLPRTCRAVNCVGFRRSLVEMLSRGLYGSPLCDGQISEMEGVIIGVKGDTFNGLSSACRSYLNIPRQYECFRDTVCYYNTPVAPPAPTDDCYHC